MDSAKVSVICLCHNHAEFVIEAIHSVLAQTYKNIELIVVDDGSTDNSKAIISKIAAEAKIQFIDIKEPLGNCKAFNIGLKHTTGEYIIDLAADDFLIENRIEEGIRTFSQKPIGVEFCNVLNIDKDGKEIGRHFPKSQAVPEGDLYEKLITTYIISPPGMMIKKSVLEDLNGYDERLSYEDFDFWIRSSRDYEYGYTDMILVKKRDVPYSLSKRQFRFLTKHQRSTLRVCKKIRKLNQYKREDLALRKRCLYEIKNCFLQGNIHLIPAFLKLCF